MKNFLHVFFVLSFILIMTDSCSNKQLAIEENAYLDSLVNVVLLQSSSATSVISVVPEKLFYDPGRTVTFSGKIVDAEGKAIPEVQAEIDNPLLTESVLGPKTNKEGRFTYTVAMPNRAGIYAFGFTYNTSKSYAIISLTPQSGLKLTNTLHKINLGVSSTYTVADLALQIKMSGTSGLPKANQEQLSNAAKQISSFMAGDRSGSILEFVTNPATDVAYLAAVACAGESWTGVGTNPYSTVYNLVLAPGAVSTIIGPVTSAIDKTSMSAIDKAYWTDAVKTGKCTIGILSLDPSTASAEVSKIATGWTCGSAAVTVAGNNNISIVASPSTSSASQNVVGIALIKKNTSPAKPSAPNPTGGATGVSLEPTLTWTSSDADGDVIKYNIYFGESTSAPLKVSGQTEASYKPGTLVANKKYYWKIVALDSKGGEGSGEWWSFTTIAGATNTVPNSPSAPSPAGGAINISLTPTLSWTGSDPDGDALTYNVFFGENTSATIKVTGQAQTTYSPGTLVANKTYYWKIVAKDGKGGEKSSEWWSFTTLGATTNNSPARPSAPNPAGGSTNVSLTPTLTWTSSDPDGDVIKYNIYFGDSTSATVKVTGQTEASYKPGTLVANKKYYWKIVALDGKGGEGSGEWWNFTTATGN